MSITNTKAKSVYNANGTTTEWNLGFTYDDTVSNVHIYIVDANDNETEVTNNYSISNGVLTYPTTASGLAPLAEGNKLVIVRDTPRTQDIELTSNGKLNGKVLEGGYDKLTLQVQELTEQVNRAVKIPVTEDSADNFLDPITAITEAKKEALVEIAQATTPAEVAKDTAIAKAQVATEQATIATNAATSAKAAQVGAEQAEQNATAQAEKAENAVTAFVEGLGTAKNAVIDLGIFDGQTSITSSRTIEFSNTPIAVSLRFSDTNKKLWINGTNSTVGIEVIDNTHCNLFYSIASADFVGQNAVKGPFVVQAIIQYPLLENAATEEMLGAVKLATKAEAEAGTNDTKAMTPLKTKYAIEANATVQTLRNDIDDLGDQVATIEGKIPAEATTANPLADKEFVTTITDELAADITALDADKQDKLTAGTNITIKDNVISVVTGGDNGIKGDYCTTYGIIDAPNGILTNPSGMEVVLKQGVVLQLAGQDIKTTISGDLTHTITSTADCDLFYVSGTTSLMEVAQTVWSLIEPDNGQAGVLAWWNPDNKKWKFKSNDTGNVWAEAVATPVAHIHTNGTTITRIDHIGYRVLDDEVYALKSEKVAKAGDTMTGPLKMSGEHEVRFGTDDNFYYVKKGTDGLMQGNGTAENRLLTTADLPGSAGSTIQGAVNYSAQVSITSPFTCPTGGAIGFRCARADYATLFLQINNILVFQRDGGEYSGASQSMFATVSAGDVISWIGSPYAAFFWPAK